MTTCTTNTEKNILELARDISLDIKNLPKHIAFIMDGNGRWAQKHGKQRSVGHKAGVQTLKRLVKYFVALNIPVMTIYAFSTENWKRPREEVDFLMKLFKDVIDRECNELKDNGVRINFIGKTNELSPALQQKIAHIKEETMGNSRLILNVAVNYGARSEIMEAVKNIGKDLLAGNFKPDEIDEKMFENYLFTRGLPDPDLLIRTSGEMRISNYLLWQIAYTEFWTTDVCWPDFSQENLLEALKEYQQRNRRFGAT